MLVLVMTLIGSGVFYAAVVENRAALNDLRQSQTFYIAEAGLNTALRELADGDGTNDFTTVFNAGGTTTLFTNKSFSGGSFTVTAQPAVGSNPKRITLTATGCEPAATGTNPCPSANTQTTVQGAITYQLDLAGPFFALGTFSIGGGQSLVDSFDSSLGTYATTNCQKTTAPFDCGANVSANGAGASAQTTTVNIGNGTPVYGNITDSRGQIALAGTIYGNATYDPVNGGCPNCNSTSVKGSIIQASTTPVVPPAVQPCGPPYSPVAYVQSKITPTNQYTYTLSTGAFSMSPNKSVTIAGGNFCFGTMSVKGTINVTDQTTPVVITVTGSIDVSAGGIANTTLKAQQFQLLSSASGVSNNIKVTGGSSTYMYVYAPQTQIVVTGGGDIYGALLGNDLQANGGAKLHFDKALGNSGLLAGGVPTYAWSAGSWKACKNPSCT